MVDFGHMQRVELAKRRAQIRRIRSEMFDKQLALVDDPEPFRCAHPGRRSGKSETIPRGAALDVLSAGFEEVVILGAETQKKARALHWQKLRSLVARHGLDLRPNAGDGEWSTPWGARIVFWGIKDQNSVELLRGFKLRSAWFDECFPAGTLVDGRPIESLRPGDAVRCVDHETGSVVTRGVVGVSEKTAAELVEVRHEQGVLRCTPNHPFFVVGVGYVAAEELKAEDVLCVRIAVQSEVGQPQGEDVREALRKRAEASAESGPVTSALFERVASETAGGHEGKADAVREGRERQGVAERRNACVRASELLGPWSRHRSWKAPRRLSEELQSRLRVAREEAGNRSGRAESPDGAGKSSGREEGCALIRARVESVTRVKRGGECGYRVYNLEVAGGHTYFAEGVLVHNCATYDPLLENLCESVLEPALGDTGGRLTLCGTPSVTRAGYWFEVCEGVRPGWSRHHWTVLDNPRFPRDARAWLADVLRRRGWTQETATFLREYLGQFVNDTNMQVYRYVSAVNDVHEMPPGFWEQHRAGLWAITMGVDFGYADECAWVVLGSHAHSRDTFVLHARKETGLLTDAAAAVTAELCELWRPDCLVGDSGGLGKPYVEQWNRRHAGRLPDGRQALPGQWGLPIMHAADKREKLAHIALANDELTAPLALVSGEPPHPPRIRFVQPACKPLTSELQVLPWSDPFRTKEHPAYANHCADGFLYALTKHRAYMHEAPAPRLADRDPDEAMAWLEQLEAEEGKAGQQVPDWARF